MNAITILVPENFAVEEAADLRRDIYDLINKGEKNFVLDFSKCGFIDSTGLGVLVSAYKKCMEKDGSFKLSSVRNAQVLKIFNLTRLDKVFEINQNI